MTFEEICIDERMTDLFSLIMVISFPYSSRLADLGKQILNDALEDYKSSGFLDVFIQE